MKNLVVEQTSVSVNLKYKNDGIDVTLLSVYKSSSISQANEVLELFKFLKKEFCVNMEADDILVAKMIDYLSDEILKRLSAVIEITDDIKGCLK